MGCGTRTGYMRHLRAGETTCDECRTASRVAVAEWRATRNQPAARRPAVLRSGCGTYAGANHHWYRREELCPACLVAQREYKRTLRRRSTRGRWVEVVLDYIETFAPVTTKALYERIGERHPDIRLDTLQRTIARLMRDGRIVVAYGDGVPGDPHRYKIARQ